jgi:hypothetical protein
VRVGDSWTSVIRGGGGAFDADQQRSTANRIKVSVFTPGWNTAARVNLLTSAVTSK